MILSWERDRESERTRESEVERDKGRWREFILGGRQRDRQRERRRK